MNRLERLLLPQPDFESGEKTFPGVVSRRLFQRLGNVERINQITTPYLSPETRNVKLRVQEEAQKADEFYQPAWQLLQRNIVYLPDQVFVRASPFHCDNWLRDSFISMLFVDDLPELELSVLEQFNNPDIHPQLPTNRLFPGNRSWAFDDESTMLGLIWRAKLWRRGIVLSRDEEDEWLERWQWIKKHVEDGFYNTPAGAEHSWFDTFKFPEADVVTYNQGIYAVAAISARQMLLEEDRSVVKAAARAYRSLTHLSRRLQFSQKLPYTDCSALFGEFLAIHFFDRKLLSDEIVGRTMRWMPKINGRIPVVLRTNGSYLLSSEFNRPYQVGDYHNGAEWPVWSAIAQATAELHGARHDSFFWQDLLSRLQKSNHAEYIFTGSRGGQHNPSRENNLWNTAVYLAAEKVVEQEEMREIVRSRKSKPTLYSEASQIS